MNLSGQMRLLSLRNKPLKSENHKQYTEIIDLIRSIKYYPMRSDEIEYIISKGFHSSWENNRIDSYMMIHSEGGIDSVYQIKRFKDDKNKGLYQWNMNSKFITFEALCSLSKLLDYNEYKLLNRSKVIKKLLDRSI
jgi:hypothetical protein